MPPIRVLVVGLGNMGLSHARAYRRIDGFEIVRLCSRDVDARPEIAAEFPGVPHYDDYYVALAASRAEAVAIATWPDTHAAFARAALEAGAHVFIEKPLAETVEAAEALVALARAKRRKLMVGYNPARASLMGEVRRNRPHARQAAGHADEPQPAVVRRAMGDAQEADGDGEPDRRLRRPLHPTSCCKRRARSRPASTRLAHG